MNTPAAEPPGRAASASARPAGPAEPDPASADAGPAGAGPAGAAPGEADRAEPAASGAGTPEPGAGPGQAGAHPLRWVIGAVAAIGIAWLAFSLVSFLTTYPLLNVTNWKAVGVYRFTEEISFSVTNSGTGRATGCRGHLRLGDGRQFSRAEPSIPHDKARKFVVTYPKSAASSRYEATVWAQCGSASTIPTPISAPANVALIASRAAVRTGHSATTVRFFVQNRGAQGAAGCTAYLRLSTGQVLSRHGQPTVPADAPVQSALGSDQAATFTVAFRTGTRGTPDLAWASCRSPDSPGGRAISTKTAVPNG